MAVAGRAASSARTRGAPFPARAWGTSLTAWGFIAPAPGSHNERGKDRADREQACGQRLANKDRAWIRKFFHGAQCNKRRTRCLGACLEANSPRTEKGGTGVATEPLPTA
jgi:hypothetical protein